MATITISTLPLVTTISDTSFIPMETGNITQRISGLNLKNYVAALSTVGATSGTISGLFTAGSLLVNGTAQINGILSTGQITASTGLITNLIGSTLSISGGTVLAGLSSTANIATGANVNAGFGVYASTLSGNIITPAQTAITSIGTLGILNVTANVSAANFIGSLIGDGTKITGLQTSQLSVSNLIIGSTTIALGATAPSLAGLTSVTSVNFAGNLSGAVLNPSQPAITTVGTLAGLTVSGNILPDANVSINLGSTSSWFNTFYGLATQAQYADLAEMYTADVDYVPGTVLVFGDVTEVTVSTIANDTKVAGVVSTNPAYLMNSMIAGTAVAVALTGRVPCKVIGTIRRGDMLVCSQLPGVAMASSSPAPGSIIGKALGSYNSDIDVGVIEVVVGRL